MLSEQTGQLVAYNSYAQRLGVSGHSIRRWLEILRTLYFCYKVSPWTGNVSRSLIKESKYYAWDWSSCKDEGARAENFIASHLLKAVHYWTDEGFAEYKLHFIRDKYKREVDFAVIRDGKPWFLVEVKNRHNKGISPHLHYFHQKLQTEHAFQVVIEAPYVEADCFASQGPTVVPARTFLSQLV